MFSCKNSQRSSLTNNRHCDCLFAALSTVTGQQKLRCCRGTARRPTSVGLLYNCTNKSSAVAKMGDCLVTIDMGRKVGAAVPPFGGGELGSHLTQCGQGRALLHAKFHLDPSNRLATIHQRHRQTDRQTMVLWHRANRFTNGCPKSHLKRLIVIIE